MVCIGGVEEYWDVDVMCHATVGTPLHSFSEVGASEHILTTIHISSVTIHGLRHNPRTL